MSFDALEEVVERGKWALNFKEGDDWNNFKKFIITTLENKAVKALAGARNDEDRLFAQQLFLASRQIESEINNLIELGKHAMKEIADQRDLESK